MTFGSLFAGIGGFDLGFERAGMTCKWQVEIDPYCQRVLAKHWPNVRRHDDVKTFPPTEVEDWRVDVICGGFPCQDISNSGKRAGIDGERSGLWSEYARIIRVLRPRFVVVENVTALLVRGIDRVLGDLAEIGFDAEWSMLSACRMGAPHMRKRMFIVANDATVRQAWNFKPNARTPRNNGRGMLKLERADWWTTEPRVGRVDHGVPYGVDRIAGLGNAVVPQAAEWIGRRLMEIERNHSRPCG